LPKVDVLKHRKEGINLCFDIGVQAFNAHDHSIARGHLRFDGRIEGSIGSAPNLCTARRDINCLTKTSGRFRGDFKLSYAERQ